MRFVHPLMTGVLGLALGASGLLAMGSRPDGPLARAEAKPAGESAPSKFWVFFRDKGHVHDSSQRRAVEDLAATYNSRATGRRALRRTRPGLFDADDLPVHDAYVRAVVATGATKHIESRWLNAISAFADARQARRIAALPFVASVEPVRKGRLIEPNEPRDAIGREKIGGGSFYGASLDQLIQINVAALHDAGFTGAGVVLGVLDTGFKRTHEAFNEPGHTLNVIAEWDFINNDGNTANEAGDPATQHNHGTWILGTMGAYQPGTLVGAAYDASYILCKTEDVSQEVIAEEDNYVAGLEFIEASGGDIATSSLGYIDWYTQEDLDGLTAITTRAVNIAISNGVFCCTAAGNEGHDDDPDIAHLIAPADAFGVITCGAANSTGTIASFSSDGPTAAPSPEDRRVKPEVLARGVSTQTVSVTSDTAISGISGTSLSTPLVTGAVACLLQAHPAWTVGELRTHLFQTASDYLANGMPDPLFIRGYGMINGYRAARRPCPADSDFSGDVNVADLLDLLAAWGACGAPETACGGDVDFSGDVNVSDVLDLLAGWGPCP